MFSGLVLSNLHDLAAKPLYSTNEQLQNERLDYDATILCAMVDYIGHLIHCCILGG